MKRMISKKNRLTHIIIGKATIYGNKDHKGEEFWVLPGGEKTYSHDKALKTCSKISEMMSKKLKNKGGVIW